MPTNERDIIIEHVLDLDNKENLEVALDIISRTQDIRSRIIKRRGNLFGRTQSLYL